MTDGFLWFLKCIIRYTSWCFFIFTLSADAFSSLSLSHLMFFRFNDKESWQRHFLPGSKLLPFTTLDAVDAPWCSWYFFGTLIRTPTIFKFVGPCESPLTVNIRRGPKLEGCTFANCGISSGARRKCTSGVWREAVASNGLNDLE